MTAFYNDTDLFVADWLESLIAHGHIPQGTVDRRSIADLTSADVAGPGQRHFFAGIGGWAYALRLAGVPDDADIWTGSCPCQGLSDAGQRRGFLDPRHLWPAWLPLIEQCRPPVIFGEQVASTLGLQWLDLVSSDLERCGYTVGAADLCAAGVGAPHARQRLFFVAYAAGESGRLLVRSIPRGRLEAASNHQPAGSTGDVANSEGKRRRQGRQATGQDRAGPSHHGAHGELADADRAGLEVWGEQQARRQRPSAQRGGAAGDLGDTRSARGGRDPRGVPGAQAGRPGGRDGDRRLLDLPVPPGSLRGFWADAEWILCRDPTGGPPIARPVEPGTSPLVTGVPGRVGLLRGYGNSIVPQVAAEFVMAAMEAIFQIA